MAYRRSHRDSRAIAISSPAQLRQLKVVCSRSYTKCLFWNFFFCCRFMWLHPMGMSSGGLSEADAHKSITAAITNSGPIYSLHAPVAALLLFPSSSSSSPSLSSFLDGPLLVHTELHRAAPNVAPPLPQRHQVKVGIRNHPGRLPSPPLLPTSHLSTTQRETLAVTFEATALRVTVPS